jgi:TolB-like protein/Flp pilus assembly protein TadD
LDAPDIFVSYNREDAAIAQRYADAFAVAGLVVWWDATLRSGEAYDAVTEAALRHARAVVVLWSPRSVDSRWVRAEATIADRNKTLMPVTIEPCERPVMFELTQTADLTHWHGQGDDPAWLAFLGDVLRKIGREADRPPDTPHAEVRADAAGGVPLIAMLPIAHRLDDEELEALAEDLTDEITRELAQSPYFRVIAVGAMAAPRGQPVDSQALGRQLQANYLVQSKLQRVGDAIRLTAQLVDAGTGSMLQSARLARSQSQLVMSPEEFAGAAASHLGVIILHVQMDRAVAKQGQFSGWDHILRARACTQSSTLENARRFLAEARAAVKALPDLNLAHAMLAAGLTMEITAGHGTIGDALACEIQSHIKASLQFGVTNAIVIGYLMVAHEGLGDGEACLRLARRAVELSPNSPRAQFLVGQSLCHLGRTADAIAAFNTHDRMSPTDDARNGALTRLGQCYLLDGRLVEAEAALDQALAVQADAFLALKWKAIVAAERGDDPLALATLKRLRQVEPGMTLDEHIGQMVRWPKLAEVSGQAVATLRRLWDAG